MSEVAREIQIRGEPRAGGQVCRFVVDREVYAGGSVVCASAERAKGSLLLEALFGLPGITQVWVAGNVVTVRKDGGEEWPVVGKKIGALIRAQLQSGRAFEPPARVGGLELGAEAAERLRRLLDEKINPGVAGHGGRIELVELRGTEVHLRMSGGCQGCSSAQATLRQGVEKVLRAEMPEITQVVDVTDHGAGLRPHH